MFSHLQYKVQIVTDTFWGEQTYVVDISLLDQEEICSIPFISS